MPTFDFRGYRVWYQESGAGEPMVFLHNGGNDHRIWDHQVAHFQKTHRVFVLDHIGYGNSDKPEIDYSLPLYTEEVAAFLDTLSLKPAILVGHCIGAAMALNYTLRHPENVRALVLCNIATEHTLCAGPLKAVYEGFRHDPAARDAFVASFEGRLSREQTDAALKDQFGPGAVIEPEFAAHIHELWNRPGQMRSLYRNLACFESFGALDRAERPAEFPPTLVVWGGANAILPPAGSRELIERLRPEQMVVVEGAGHLCMRERPGFFNEAIEAFLSKVLPLSAADR